MGNGSKASGVVRPEDLYRWPDAVQARLGVGRSVYELVRVGGLRVQAFGRRRYVRGRDVIEALDRLSNTESYHDSDPLRTIDPAAAYSTAQAKSCSSQ